MARGTPTDWAALAGQTPPLELPQSTIEPGDPEEEDEFSLDEVDPFDDTTSITTSVYQHTHWNGRRYHKFRHGRYPFPNDDREQSREDMLHAMMLEATDGKLFMADIAEHPANILDLGTGTGIWAIESKIFLEESPFDSNCLLTISSAPASGQHISWRSSHGPGPQPYPAMLGAAKRPISCRRR